MRILITGGAGYIGSHACTVLAERGHALEILDNHSNSAPEVVARIGRIVGRAIAAHRIDLRDADALDAVFAAGSFDAVVHFAALKSVGESCARPLDYFDNNIAGTIGLLRAMRRHGVGRLVFSSSATVYGDPDSVPIAEDAPLRTTNPYGRTKLVMEQLIGDLCASDPGFTAVNLRYFNPVGAHPGGTIGEDPGGIPNNLMPYVCQVAVGRRERLQVFGGDWPTRDGSGVRDYIHVMDLAHAHADAIDYLASGGGSATVNLGTGRGVSVLELVRAFEAASGRTIPYDVVGRRAGDVAEVYADPALAKRLFGWQARHDIAAMCRDAWHWQSANPEGFAAVERQDGG